MTQMIEIPASSLGRGVARSVPAGSPVRLEVRLPAELVRDLTLESNREGIPIARIVAHRLARTLRQE